MEIKSKNKCLLNTQYPTAKTYQSHTFIQPKINCQTKRYKITNKKCKTKQVIFFSYLCLISRFLFNFAHIFMHYLVNHIQIHLDWQNQYVVYYLLFYSHYYCIFFHFCFSFYYFCYHWTIFQDQFHFL